MIKKISKRNMKKNFWGSGRFKIIDVLRNTKILSTLKELKEQQYYEKTELDSIIDDRLNSLLKIARESTDYYANEGGYEAIKPLVKNEIKKNHISFISKAYKLKLYKKATGGSTGSPLLYYTTRESISYLWAGILLSWEVAGYQLGERVAFLAGTSIIKKDFKHEIFYRLMNVKLYSTYTLNESKIIEYLENMRFLKVKLIYGYATALAYAADIMNQRKIKPLEELKSIVSTAEVLTEENRRKIEKAFNVRVYNQYGCNEAGISAFECERGNMHLISTRCKYEVDHEGNLLSTDLTNKGFILMKYFTGDQIELSENTSCPCKRNYPIIKNIKGRSYDMIIDSKKNIIHAAFFNILFKNDPTIRQFQVQFNTNKICVFLNTDNTKSSTRDYQHYIESIKKHFTFNEYEIILNTDLLKSKSAKHRYVINTGL